MGTKIRAQVVRVVDGDTVRVVLEGASDEESLRILALDTEESRAGSGKPVTPLGHKAKEDAENFFSAGDDVVLEYPGLEDADVCLTKYRGNYGRLLVFLYKGTVDFQEHMIQRGYSPYFVKYGYAALAENHQRYIVAERTAQQNHLGVWDQVGENGSEVRNYAALGTWWRLRAEVIKQYRNRRVSVADLYNSRLDYEKLLELARQGKYVTIFTELRSLERRGTRSAVIRIGSHHQPFSVWLPNIENDVGQDIVQLLNSRYIPGDEAHPRRSYAYVKGALSLYNDRPQIEVTVPDQIVDDV